MFDILPKLLSSVASFLFPLFASYKALKTSDPAQLTPWLMYWVVLACVVLVESWTDWILAWIPLYSYMRLCFLLYLVLPQTQGARVIYTSYVHPYLEENEASIEDFIATIHDRAKSAGIQYIKAATEAVRTSVLGLPPSANAVAATRGATTVASREPKTYTQSLLDRFQLPQARWNPMPDGAIAGGLAGQDIYNLLAGAWGSVAPAVAGKDPASSASIKSVSGASPDMAFLKEISMPSGAQTSSEKLSFLAAQRERLSLVLSALDRETLQLQYPTSSRRSIPNDPTTSDDSKSSMIPPAMPNEQTVRPMTPSGRSVASGLSRGRSEADFEKIDAESGAEENDIKMDSPPLATPASGVGSWMPWGWGSGGGGTGGAGGGTTASPAGHVKVD